jgi:hypothetical protein
MTGEGTVLLVEADEEVRQRLGEALEGAGYQVIGCSGPTAPEYTCIGGRESYCPLVERADVVVLDLWLAGDEEGLGTSSDELLEMYAGRGRTVVTLGHGDWRDPYAVGHVVHLDERPTVDEIIAAVRGAHPVEGFVLRRA